MRRTTTIAAAGLLVVLTAAPAHAYLDPGSGSMLLQLVLGGVAGFVVLVKLYWQKLKALVGLGRTEKGRP
ncbi:MAG TPA: hypothetical protein VIM86_13010 [Thermodesulfobacteriota bacterium]